MKSDENFYFNNKTRTYKMQPVSYFLFFLNAMINQLIFP